MNTYRRIARTTLVAFAATVVAAGAPANAVKTESVILATFETSTGLGFESGFEPGLATFFTTEGERWGSKFEFGASSREKLNVGGSAQWGRLYLTRELGDFRVMAGIWGSSQKTDAWQKSTFGPTLGVGYGSVELRLYAAEAPDKLRVGALRWQIPLKRLKIYVEAGAESFSQPSGAQGTGAIFSVMVGPKLRFR